MPVGGCGKKQAAVAAATAGGGVRKRPAESSTGGSSGSTTLAIPKKSRLSGSDAKDPKEENITDDGDTEVTIISGPSVSAMDDCYCDETRSGGSTIKNGAVLAILNCVVRVAAKRSQSIADIQTSCAANEPTDRGGGQSRAKRPTHGGSSPRERTEGRGAKSGMQKLPREKAQGTACANSQNDAHISNYSSSDGSGRSCCLALLTFSSQSSVVVGFLLSIPSFLAVCKCASRDTCRCRAFAAVRHSIELKGWRHNISSSKKEFLSFVCYPREPCMNDRDYPSFGSPSNPE